MLIGYVSDEQHVAIANAQLEFAQADTTVEVRSRASGAVHVDIPPGRWTVTIARSGYTRKFVDIDVAIGMAPHRFRLLSDQLLGYAWPKWAQAGGRVELRIHAPEPYRASIWRYGWEKRRVRDLGFFDSFGPGGDRQIVPDGDFTIGGCRWNENGYPFGPDPRHVIEAPGRSGLYYVHLKGTRSGAFYSFPLIVAPPAPSTDLAVLASTMNWNAYNDFGGRSNYVAAGALPAAPAVNVRQRSPYLVDTGGRFWDRADNDYDPLSFDRPEPANRVEEDDEITTPMWRIGSEHVAPATWRLVGWLEREGISYDFYAENQLDSGVLDLDRYRTLVLDQHPEYWTRTMYDTLRRWVFLGGGRLIYLGGNGLDCEIELVEGGRAARHLNGDRSYWVERREFSGGPFSFPPRRIERDGAYECPAHLLGVRTTLTGMGTAAPYRVHDADHFAFAGTGLQVGDLFGRESLDMRNPGGASGHETDRTCEHAPVGTRLLAKGVNPHDGGSEMVYFETESGGAVFSTGSISWICSLPIDDDVSNITANVIRNLSVGEAGKPAVTRADPKELGG
jgi:N,N-dimethylformamidase